MVKTIRNALNYIDYKFLLVNDSKNKKNNYHFKVDSFEINNFNSFNQYFCEYLRIIKWP